jgi:hypothetical protein
MIVVAANVNAQPLGVPPYNVSTATQPQPILPIPPTSQLFVATGTTPAWAVNPLYQGGLTITGADFSGGYYTMPTTSTLGPPSTAGWPIQVGDWVELYTGAQAQVYPIIDIQLTQLNPNATTSNPEPFYGSQQIALITGPSDVTVGTNPGVQPVLSTSNFRVIRAPRLRINEMPQQLPANVVIDLSVNNTGSYPSNYANSNWPTPTAGANGYSHIDILFSPSGEIISPGVSSDLKFWLRDTSEDQPTTYTFGGEQFIVIANIRTGMVATQPVDVTTTTDQNTSDPPAMQGQVIYSNPYFFTQDGNYGGY